MSHDHPQPEGNTGHLVFPTGGVVSGNAVPFEPGPPPYVLPEGALHHVLPEGTTVQVNLDASIDPAAMRHVVRTHPVPSTQAAIMRDVPEGAYVMPSGHWVTIRDAKTLTRGDKRNLLRDGQPVEGQSTAERIMTVQDLMHRMLITAWSYPYPLPSQDLSSLDRLPLQDDEALDDLVDEANAMLFPGRPSPDQHADPDSPTAPSGE
jgi:hypothetical protein